MHEGLPQILAAGIDPTYFAHVEAGITISDLSILLDHQFVRQALGSSGGSGQTLAGFLSTGAHGGDSLVPPLADFVRAIHLVGAGGVEHWIEPDTGITDPAKLQVVYPCLAPDTIHYDTSLFNAVLVSAGSMGVIYSVILSTVRQFGLVQHRLATTWEDLISADPTLTGLLDGSLLEAAYRGLALSDAALGGAAKQLAVAANQDGRLEVFYIGTDDLLYHNWQTKANNGWAGQAALGGAAKQLAVAANQDGRLEVFYIGTDDLLYHNWQTKPNSGWAGQAALGGAAKQVTVDRNQDGRLEVFYVGTDDLIYHNWQTKPNAGWAGQAALGGAAKQLAVAANQDGRLEVFYIGTDDLLYHNWQTSPNNGWNGETLL